MIPGTWIHADKTVLRIGGQRYDGILTMTGPAGSLPGGFALHFSITKICILPALYYL
jgi:hypothetical protein